MTKAIIKQYLLSSWHLESKSRPKIRVEDQAINKRLEHSERTLRTHQRKHLREHGDLLRAFRIVRTWDYGPYPLERLVTSIWEHVQWLLSLNASKFNLRLFLWVYECLWFCEYMKVFFDLHVHTICVIIECPQFVYCYIKYLRYTN